MGRWIVIIWLVLGPAPLWADIYKCVSRDGIVRYSDQPCGEDASVITHTASVDDLIAMSRPYRRPFQDPNGISKDLRSHSKLIGDHIIPGGRYLHRDVGVGHKHRTVWTVTMAYKTVEHRPWRIRLTYHREKQSNGDLFWLTSISVFKWGKPATPPAMRRITRLHNTGPGAWVAPEP